MLIQSSSAAGKSALMDAVLAFVPEEERVQYSAMTGQSLFYMGETSLKHSILAIAEEEGAQPRRYALKLLQSEGELTIASTGKDPGHRHAGDPGLHGRRAGDAVPDHHGHRHRRGIAEPLPGADRQRGPGANPGHPPACSAAEADPGRSGRARAEASLLELHRNAQRLLRPLAVVNPYADQLTFLDDQTRTRRDHEKYLTLIGSIALLHQHQRPVQSTVVEGQTIDYVEVTAADIATANALAHEVLGRSLDELPPQTRRVLAAIVGHVREEAQRRAIRPGDVRFSRADIRRRSGLADTQCRLHLDRLIALEYLLTHRGQRGQSFEYELLYDGAIEDGAPHLAGLIAVDTLRSASTMESSRGTESRLAGSSRGHDGPNAAPSQGAVVPENKSETMACGDAAADVAKPHSHGLNGEARSYPQTPVVIPLAASA